MSAWLIFIALVSIASMPTAFRMARTRGRSTYVWLVARARAFQNVPLYKAIFENYKGGVLPPAGSGGATWATMIR
jgi:hypothetical protein